MYPNYTETVANLFSWNHAKTIDKSVIYEYVYQIKVKKKTTTNNSEAKTNIINLMRSICIIKF